MKIASTKINKAIVNKLVYTHTKRLLKIIGYQSNESDSKRLEYAVAQYGDNKMKLLYAPSNKSDDSAS